MSAAPGWHEFGDGAALASALAQAVAADLRTAIAARGCARLVVSGGRTPQAFLTALARQALDWPRVIVTLADERWLPPDHPRSNERLLRSTLLQGAAAAARFVPLYRDLPVASAVAQLERELAHAGLPFDVVVLGMGLDGHTASLFADADGLAAALDPQGVARVMLLQAPSAGEPRMTLTLRALASSRRLYLHIEGAAKRELYESPRLAGSPLATVLATVRAPVAVYWAP
ncbi:MAG: 6-phosphogluconolactonase [Dokdonella sp.]|nr:MAG: 6-phosphogluconolactonase [Dokdonella sp.]